jgi:hypothetical protein
VFYENQSNEADLFSLLERQIATLKSIRVYCMEQDNDYSLFEKELKAHRFFGLTPEGLEELYIENKKGNFFFFFSKDGK